MQLSRADTLESEDGEMNQFRMNRTVGNGMERYKRESLQEYELQQNEERECCFSSAENLTLETVWVRKSCCNRPLITDAMISC